MDICIDGLWVTLKVSPESPTLLFNEWLGEIFTIKGAGWNGGTALEAPRKTGRMQNTKGYYAFSFNNKYVFVHRAIFYWTKGIPVPKGTIKDGVIDHINNDRSDNRYHNLQLIQNRENVVKSRLISKKRKHKLPLNVYFESKRQVYFVAIQAYKNGKRKTIGMGKFSLPTVDAANLLAITARAYLHINGDLDFFEWRDYVD